MTLSTGDSGVKDTHSSAESSDSEDEEYIEGDDDKESEEEELEELRGTATADTAYVENGSADGTIPEEPQRVSARPKKHSAPPKSCSFDQVTEEKKMTSSNSFDSLSGKESTTSKEARPRIKKQSAFNFDINIKKSYKDNSDVRKVSTESDPGLSTEYQQSQHSRLHRKGAFKVSRNGRSTTSAPSPQSPGQDKWANRRYV